MNEGMSKRYTYVITVTPSQRLSPASWKNANFRRALILSSPPKEIRPVKLFREKYVQLIFHNKTVDFENYCAPSVNDSYDVTINNF